MTKRSEPDDVIDEMLQAAQRAEAARRNKSQSFASICMHRPTVGISAIYGKVVASDEAAGTVNKNETVSLHALMAYVAHNQNARLQTVRAAVNARFDVERIEDIRRDDYEAAVRFLVDWRMSELN